MVVTSPAPPRHPLANPSSHSLLMIKGCAFFVFVFVEDAVPGHPRDAHEPVG